MSPNQAISIAQSKAGSQAPVRSNIIFVLFAAVLAVALGVAAVKPVYGLLIATIAVMVAVAPFTIFEPLIFTCALVVFTISNLTDILIVKFSLPSVTKILTVVIAASLYLRAKRNASWPRIDLAAILILLAYVFATGMTVFWAYYPDISAIEFGGMVRDIVVVVLLLAVLQSMDDVRAISRSIIAGLVLISTLGALNAATSQYGRDMLGLATFSIEHIAGDIDSYRFIGPLTDPNALGRILLIGIPFAVYEFIWARSHLGRLLAALCAVSLVIGLVLTFSRGAMLAFGVMASVAMWNHRRYLLRIAVILMPCAVLFASILPQSYWSRAEVLLGLASERTIGAIAPDQSVDNRMEEMQAAAFAFADHPVRGVGYANFPFMFEKYALDYQFRPRFEPRESHSEILRVAAEQGLLGLIVYLLLWGRAVWNSARVHNQLQASDPRNADLAFALTLALIGYFSASLFLHEAYARNAWLILGMALALPQFTSRSAQRQASGSTCNVHK